MVAVRSVRGAGADRDPQGPRGLGRHCCRPRTQGKHEGRSGFIRTQPRSLQPGTRHTDSESWTAEDEIHQIEIHRTQP